MVDLALLQSVSYIAGALGVCVAAFYYVLNLTEQRKNMKLTLETRRITIINSLMERIINKEAVEDYFEIMNYEWSNYEEFERKYGSDNNIEATAKRYALLNKYDQIGSLVKKGFVNMDDLYDLTLTGLPFLWAKYGDVIEEGRKRYNGSDFLVNFEFLANEALRIKVEKDPSYKVPENLTKYVSDS
jgi:hypothetical protein